MRKLMFMAAAAFALASSCSAPRTLHVFTTNDVHGCYFDSTYISGGRTRASLYAVNAAIDARRNTLGRNNVLFIDAGDCLQGDNAAYYFNYVDTVSKHVYARMAEYMKYDAVTVGNHDVETGHPVYDRIRRTMDIPFLATNAVREDNANPYFDDYVIVKRAGLRVAVIGFTNANIKGWLSPSIWSGMDFLSLTECVQEKVDEVSRAERPDVVVVSVHSGTGSGDGQQLESQGLDLLNTLHGVDFLVCAHDHRPYVEVRDDIALLNSGSHCRNLAHGTITLDRKGGKKLDSELIPIDKSVIDTAMQAYFHKDYLAVKDFTLRKVGTLAVDLKTRDAYRGMCDYMNFVHKVCMEATLSQISLAAPLTYNGFVHSGELVYNDLFTIYPFENQLFVINMTGRQIKNYLEYSYSNWINTISCTDDTLLKITEKDGQWKFDGRSYNFDSAAGLIYKVDVTKPYGEKVIIESLADGSPFREDATYSVSMTSYRANGGGFLLEKGALISTPDITARYPEIRELIYQYLQKHPDITPDSLSEGLGYWKFIPEDLVRKPLSRDMHRLFPKWENDGVNQLRAL